MYSTAIEEIQELTDDELRQCVETAKTDLAEAAASQPDSEWHQACFAGLYMYATEACRRGLVLTVSH